MAEKFYRKAFKEVNDLVDLLLNNEIAMFLIGVKQDNDILNKDQNAKSKNP